MHPPTDPTQRYIRQESFAPLGPAGQQRLGDSRVAIVGLGGLGSWLAELLARAGVGMLRLIDDDRVDWTNLARQAMYTQTDATSSQPKVAAAATRLAEINSTVAIEPCTVRLSANNAQPLLSDVDLLLDATDTWASRFLLNDLAVAHAKPWVLAGVVGCTGQFGAFLPGRACLQCVIESPPPPELEDQYRAVTAGVLGPAVAAIAARQACLAMQILTGPPSTVCDELISEDFWQNTTARISLARPAEDCPCCKKKKFAYLGD
jgi:molybdopterin-synthase adenylyltransferase